MGIDRAWHPRVSVRADSVKRERVSGKALQAAILVEAKRQGWLRAHFPPVRTEMRPGSGEMTWRVPVGADGKGWPDIFLLRERAIAMEIKGDGDAMRPDQRKWRSAFLMAGIQHLVVTPKMWMSGEVDDILRARTYDPTDDRESEAAAD